ncbi:hypothetical protein HID58_066852 [Brassica napus]|uniref:Uncharacterized protein n=1 Tax=Brassica napus TaxID=3708 RepID=A0ABQ7ZH97_BRANA|nr:hypothetical protein HID58_066852 [Brassica napus]
MHLIFCSTPSIDTERMVSIDVRDREGQSKADLDALTSQLCEEKNNALAMEKEIKALRLKLGSCSHAGAVQDGEDYRGRALGLPAPSFNDEHEIPGPAEAEKTPEPTDDDPPAE